MSDAEFVDAEAWVGGNLDKLSFRIIALETLRRIGTISGKEFRGGYWEERKVAVGGQITFSKVYVPDSRQEYINSVNYLADILVPHFDEVMSKAEAEHREAVRALSVELKDYWDEVLRLKRELFRSLSLFLFRVNYLESASFEGGS